MRLLLYVIIASNIVNLMSFNNASASTLPLNDRVWILSKTYQSVSTYFAHWENASYGPEAADSVFHVYLTKAIETEDRSEFTRLVREYLALLQNGHCWYTDFDEYKNSLPLGFEWKYFDNEWVVTESRIPELIVGDVVDSIGGTAVENLYQKLRTLVCASSEYARRSSFMSWALKPFLAESFTLTIRDQQGEPKTVTVDRNSLVGLVNSSKTTGYWIREPNIAYIKIPSFTESRYADDALTMIELYQNAAYLIVDVRGNPGGNAPSTLTDVLMDRPYRKFAESTPLSIALFRYYAETNGPWWNKFRNTHMMWGSTFESPENTIFHGQLLILIDRETGSAAEDFVVPFNDNNRAVIIGENTKGSTGQPYFYRFGDIGSIGIGAKRAYFPDGSPFEGVGISPDITVNPSREDLYEDNDRVLGRAVKEADM